MQRLRIAAQIVSFLVTGGSLGLDLASVGSFPWQCAALVGFGAYVLMSSWSQWELWQDIHRVERSVVVLAEGRAWLHEHGSYSWRQITHDSDNLRITRIDAHLTVRLMNRDQHRHRLSDVYLEVFQPRRWFWPFTAVIAKCDPSEVDALDSLRGAEGASPSDWNTPSTRRVDWDIEPEAPDQLHDIDFDRRWVRGDGPKFRQRFDMILVVEYGGADRSKRVRIRPPSRV